MKDVNHQATTPLPNSRPLHTISEDRLADLKGKGPREVLNGVAPPRLGMALLQSTVGTLAVMAVLTVGPYLWSQVVSSEAKKATPTNQPVKQDSADATKPEQKPTEAKPSDKKPATADNKKDQTQPAKDVLNKLKENDVKKDKPKDPFGTNSNLDDLLDKK